MNVERVRTERGSHIEPPLDERWGELPRLEWQAAVVTADTGLPVKVTPARSWLNGVRQHGVYNVDLGSAVSGSFSYGEAWIYMNGISAGAQAAQREVSA